MRTCEQVRRIPHIPNLLKPMFKKMLEHVLKQFRERYTAPVCLNPCSSASLNSYLSGTHPAECAETYGISPKVELMLKARVRRLPRAQGLL